MHPSGKKQNLLQMFGSAGRGLAHALSERNFLLLCLASIIAIILLAWVRAGGPAWIIASILIALTLAAELFNSAIETLADVLIKEHHPGIAKVKELTAGAVGIIGLTSLAIILWLLWVAYRG